MHLAGCSSNWCKDSTENSAAANYYYFTDANKKIGQLVDASGNIVAKYEYSPFGEITAQSGAYSDSNPFRFSSEYTDDESGLVYYNYRYYSPTMGRWLSRDPIEEAGGLNLYGFLGNNGVNGWDNLGLTLYWGNNIGDAYHHEIEFVYYEKSSYLGGGRARGGSSSGGSSSGSYGGESYSSGHGSSSFAGVRVPDWVAGIKNNPYGNGSWGGPGGSSGSDGGGGNGGSGGSGGWGGSGGRSCYCPVKLKYGNPDPYDPNDFYRERAKDARDAMEATKRLALDLTVGAALPGSTIAGKALNSVRGQVRRVFPSEMLNKTLDEIRSLSQKGDKAAQKAWKLLNDKRFQK